MAFAEYRAIEAVNWSTLKPYLKSAYHGLQAEQFGQQSTAAQTLGSALHCLYLEGAEKFESEVTFFPGKVRRGKEWEAFREINSEKTILTAKEYDDVLRLAKALNAHRLSQTVPFSCSTETVVVWQEHDGILRKARLDALGFTVGQLDAQIYDLKTCQDATEAGFARTCAQYWYHGQAAWYRRGVEHLVGFQLPAHAFKFIAIETETAAVARYTLTEDAFFHGNRAAQVALERYKQAREGGEGGEAKRSPVGLNGNEERQLVAFFPPILSDDIPVELEVN